MLIDFEILGNPVALKRHRTTKTGHTYDPSAKDKQNFIAQCIQHKPDKLMEGPLRLTVVCHIQRPQSHYRTGASSHMLKHGSSYYCEKRPDLSNLIKLIEDAMEGIFFKNDSQIAEYGESRKIYSDKPGIYITISTL